MLQLKSIFQPAVWALCIPVFFASPVSAWQSDNGDVSSVPLGSTAPLVTGLRGRAHLNAARTTFVADNGQDLRGPYTSTEWTTGADNADIANMRNYGFNAIHLYAESFDPSYPTNGSTAPGYSAANVDRIVAATRINGLYLIITIGNSGNNGDYNLAWATNFWRFYAPRYASETHVLYEIHNEPVAWGPPYSAANATPPGALNLEEACYRIIRTNAPGTPVLLFTYAVFSGTGGTAAALQDIQAFNTNVFGRANAVWTNEVVAFHGYGGWQATAIAVSNLISAGYPCMMTEFGASLWGRNSGGLDAQLTSKLEQYAVSWLTFQYVPPTGVSADVTLPQNYQDIVNGAGLSWVPDYGTWPVARGTYANGGLPWTTPDYSNNVLGGTLHLEAENFDSGGKGVAYDNNNGGNPGGPSRTNDTVAIATTSDAGGGYAVTGTAAGDWLEYTLWVSEPGLYNLRLRVAGAGGSVQFLAGGGNGTNLTGPWTLPATGGAQTWTTITNTVFLTPGQQVLHLAILTGGFSLNWIEFSPVAGGLVANGTYKFLNRNSSFALQGMPGNGGLAAAGDAGLASQQWNLKHLGGNLFELTSVSNGWSWSANGDGNRMGFVWWWGAGGNQCFYLQPTDSGYFRFLPVQDGLSVEATATNSAAVDEAVYDGAASQQWGVVAPKAPDFPTGLTVTPVAATRNLLTWQAVAGATSYTVQRSTNSAGPFTVIATGLTTTNFTDASVVLGTPYYYLVNALLGGVTSLNSASVGALLPYPWQTADVGAVGVAGSAGGNHGVFTVTGSGADVWNSADAFRYVYQTQNGGCTITARVVSVQAVDPWTKAGVMLRSGLASNAPNAFVAVTPGNGVTAQYRATTNGSSANSALGGLVAPYWVSLGCSNNLCSAFCSPDGTNWTRVGTPRTITLGNPVCLGLAVTAHNNSDLATATFDHVTVSPTLPAPAGLSAQTVAANQVNLTWNTLATATSYNLKRSTVSGGPYAPIATGVVSTNYADLGLAGGTSYYYVVSAVISGVESPDSAPAAATTVSGTYGALIHRYSFSETNGTTIADTIGGPIGNGVLPDGGTFSNGVLVLSPGLSQYANLPAGLLGTLSNLTLMAWVNVNSNAAWSRIFDFGNNPATYLFLTPDCGGSGTLRFAVTTNGGGAEQQINSPATVSPGAWHQVAVTLNGAAGILYLDGLPVGTNAGLTLHPADLGATTNNYLGKSQYADPYLSGELDEFRIYDTGLSAAEIAATAALGSSQQLNPGHPSLGLMLAAPDLTLSWPLASAGFTLQSRTNLGTGDWVNVPTPAPQIIGGQWRVALPPGTNAGPVFYRLLK
jgi:hypothetical protein